MRKFFLISIALLAFTRLLSQNVGIGTLTPAWKLDIRGSNPDDGQLISVGNSDQTHRMLFFGGRQNDPNPFIAVKAGDPIRFATDESGFRELMRINSDGTVGINTYTPHSSAILDIASTTKGMLIPRMTSAQRTAIITPLKGLLVFDNDTNSFWFYNGSSWIDISSVSSWGLTGNSGTNPATNFIGTTDPSPIQFRINNIKAGIIDSISFNTSIGFRTCDSVTTGTFNAAFGYKSLISNQSGSNNTALGSNTLRYNTNGSYNTAAGMQALSLNINGYRNTAVGYLSMYSDTSGYDNTAAGVFSLYSNLSGAANAANGFAALYNNTTGYSNTANGAYSLYNNKTGYYNTAGGLNALQGNTTGNNNTSTGVASMFNNSTGNSNAAYGFGALFYNTTRSNLVAVGDSALFNNGTGATGTTEATQNTAVGSKALAGNTTGWLNSALGYHSLFANSTGVGNTGAGVNALSSNTTGGYNTAIGLNALQLNSGSINNTASGALALQNNSGNNNTANGYAALYNNLTGNDNTAIGKDALSTVTTGSSNTAIGTGATVFNGAFSNATAIGAGAVSPASNSIQLGNASVTNIYTNNNCIIWASDFYAKGNGMLRNTSSIQLKISKSSYVVNSNINALSTIQIPFSYSETFSTVPMVYVGNITGGPGGFAEIIMSIANATTTGATLFVSNPRNIAVAPNFTVNIIAIGGQ